MRFSVPSHNFLFHSSPADLFKTVLKFPQTFRKYPTVQTSEGSKEPQVFFENEDNNWHHILHTSVWFNNVNLSSWCICSNTRSEQPCSLFNYSLSFLLVSRERRLLQQEENTQSWAPSRDRQMTRRRILGWSTRWRCKWYEPCLFSGLHTCIETRTTVGCVQGVLCCGTWFNTTRRLEFSLSVHFGALTHKHTARMCWLLVNKCGRVTPRGTSIFSEAALSVSVLCLIIARMSESVWEVLFLAAPWRRWMIQSDKPSFSLNASRNQCPPPPGNNSNQGVTNETSARNEPLRPSDRHENHIRSYVCCCQSNFAWSHCWSIRHVLCKTTMACDIQCLISVISTVLGLINCQTFCFSIMYFCLHFHMYLCLLCFFKFFLLCRPSLAWRNALKSISVSNLFFNFHFLKLDILLHFHSFC